MLSKRNIKKEYFNWLVNKIGYRIDFINLLSRIHTIEFRYSIKRDGNRAKDGLKLRYKFAKEKHILGIDRYLTGPCSVLEMMIALSIKCEDWIMSDPEFGDRTGQWFWDMIVNLGLGSMTNDRFDPKFVDTKINIFLNREYDPNGRGGLFTVKNRNVDLRNVEIFYQLNWYLDNIC